MKLEKNFMRNADLGLLLLRLTVGGLMLFHGIHKVTNGVGGIGEMLAAIGLPAFIAYGSLLAEVVASLMMIVGVWTRAASAVFAGNMVVAIMMAHSADIFTVNAMTGGWTIELPMLYLLGAAVLCLTGAGKYAVTRGGVFD